MPRSPYRGFVDESIGRRDAGLQEYLLAAALIPLDECADVREALRPLLARGELKWHWTDESPARKQAMVDAICSLGPMTVVVAHLDLPRRKVERYRRKCLEVMYRDVSAMGIEHLTLESRGPRQDRNDLAHLVALRQQGLDEQLRIDHLRGGEEPLLWIADAVLGSINALHRGDAVYFAQLQRTIVLDSRTPDSRSPDKSEGP